MLLRKRICTKLIVNRRSSIVFVGHRLRHKILNEIISLPSRFQCSACLDKKQIRYEINHYRCAANFSFAQLAKRKSLGRSKPATNSQAQALQHTVWNVSTISKPTWTAFYRNKLSTTRCEWVKLFISWQVQSAYNSVRSRCWEITAVVFDDKAWMMSNPVTQ